jgi:cell wall-associated NlpC family hydrolase
MKNAVKVMVVSLVVLAIVLGFAPQAQAGNYPGTPAWRAAVINDAYSWLGTKYVYGGSTRQGIDCSWFVYKAYNEVSNPQAYYNYKTASQLRAACYTPQQLWPGDLVFFKRKSNNLWEDHVGIWLGGSNFIHASGDPKIMRVIVDNFDNGPYDQIYGGKGFWTKTYYIYIMRCRPDRGIWFP